VEFKRTRKVFRLQKDSGWRPALALVEELLQELSLYPRKHAHLAKLSKVYFVVCIGVYFRHEGSNNLRLWCFAINFSQHGSEFGYADAS